MIPRYSRSQMVALWSDEARYQLWLEVETEALAAMVNLGIAPARALESVRAKAAFDVTRIDEIEKEVKHDVIAFLTAVAEHVGEDARFLHFGMTSSDLLDTAFAVQLCRATDAILAELSLLRQSVKKLAYEHRTTICIGRSHGIHAEPTTFGLKVATWYDELTRQEQRIKAARADIAVGAISGPVGTFAHLSPEVEAHVCKAFGLRPEKISTQIILRDHHAALFLAFAQLGSSLERIAVEIRHLQRTEVREAEEGFTKGQKGSSAMPHKRNPILSENINGLARLLRAWASASLENVALWHERDISHSSVERVIAPDITITLDFMLARMRSVVDNLVVHPQQMKRNLEFTRGLTASATLLVKLAAKGMSRESAYALVQKYALETWDDIGGGGADIKTFRARIEADAEVKKILTKQDLDDVFSLDRHLKQVDFIFSRVFEEQSQ